MFPSRQQSMVCWVQGKQASPSATTVLLTLRVSFSSLAPRGKRSRSWMLGASSHEPSTRLVMRCGQGVLACRCFADAGLVALPAGTPCICQTLALLPSPSTCRSAPQVWRALLALKKACRSCKGMGECAGEGSVCDRLLQHRGRQPG